MPTPTGNGNKVSQCLSDGYRGQSGLGLLKTYQPQAPGTDWREQSCLNSESAVCQRACHAVSLQVFFWVAAASKCVTIAEQLSKLNTTTLDRVSIDR